MQDIRAERALPMQFLQKRPRLIVTDSKLKKQFKRLKSQCMV